MKIASPAPHASRANPAAPDELIEKMTVDANGDAEQLWAFRQAFEDDVAVPSDAFVIGEAVSVLKFDYDGLNPTDNQGIRLLIDDVRAKRA